MMKSSKIDLLIQYAILIAGQEDEYLDRQLGPIHLIKYVYLADLAYAERNCGKTFTRYNNEEKGITRTYQTRRGLFR